MKHAGPDALDFLEPLLIEIRKQSQLKERKRGLFYRNGRSLLHFHEDPAGMFADLCANGQDIRLRISTKAEQRALLAKIREILST